MQQQTENMIFRRKSRIGMNVLQLELCVPEFLEITNFDIYNAKDGREIPKFTVVDLKTGEEKTLWVDGGLKGQCSILGGPGALVGKTVEIEYTGQKEVELFSQESKKMETVRVNQYNIFEIEKNLE